MNAAENEHHEELNRFRGGDWSAFERLVMPFKNELLNFIHSKVRCMATAEDLLQEVFVKIWQSKDRFDNLHFRGWIYTIARNVTTDSFRRNKNESSPLTSAPEPGRSDTIRLDDQHGVLRPVEQVHREEKYRILKMCFDSMSNAYKDVWVRLMDGKSQTEIQEELSLSADVFYRRKSNGAKQLKDCAGPKYEQYLEHGRVEQ